MIIHSNFLCRHFVEIAQQVTVISKVYIWFVEMCSNYQIKSPVSANLSLRWDHRFYSSAWSLHFLMQVQAYRSLGGSIAYLLYISKWKIILYIILCNLKIGASIGEESFVRLDIYINKYFNIISSFVRKLWALCEGGGSGHSRQWSGFSRNLQVTHAIWTIIWLVPGMIGMIGCCQKTPAVQVVVATPRRGTQTLKCGAL